MRCLCGIRFVILTWSRLFVVLILIMIWSLRVRSCVMIFLRRRIWIMIWSYNCLLLKALLSPLSALITGPKAIGVNFPTCCWIKSFKHEIFKSSLNLKTENLENNVSCVCLKRCDYLKTFVTTPEATLLLPSGRSGNSFDSFHRLAFVFGMMRRASRSKRWFVRQCGTLNWIGSRSRVKLLVLREGLGKVWRAKYVNNEWRFAGVASRTLDDLRWNTCVEFETNLVILNDLKRSVLLCGRKS